MNQIERRVKCAMCQTWCRCIYGLRMCHASIKLFGVRLRHLVLELQSLHSVTSDLLISCVLASGGVRPLQGFDNSDICRGLLQLGDAYFQSSACLQWMNN